jgi:hypothetical protein
MTKRVKLTVKQVAERVGDIKPATWRGLVSRGLRPQPDGHADPCGCPFWYEATIKPWMREPTMPSSLREVDQS